MIKAGIDIGTNTALMVVADVHDDGTYRVLRDVHTLPRLGARLQEHQPVLLGKPEHTASAHGNSGNIAVLWIRIVYNADSFPELCIPMRIRILVRL